jgi:drug/metabolite transporter (DMT)-like permease
MPNIKDYYQLHLIVFIWGFTAVLGDLIKIPAIELVFYRTLLSSILLGFWLYFQKKPFRIGFKSILILVSSGSLIGLHWILFFASAKISTVSVCLAGITTGTFWTSLLEPLVHKRKIRGYEIFLGLVIFLGLYVIFRFEFNHVIGLLMAVVSAILASIFSLINSKLIHKHNPYTITFYEMVGAFLCTALVLPIYDLWGKKELNFNAQWLDWLYILILAWVCTVYAYTLGLKLMHKFTPFVMHLTVNLETVYGIVLAYLILGKSEKMTPQFYVGTLIILGAVLSYPFLRKYFTKQKHQRIRKMVLKREKEKVLY